MLKRPSSMPINIEKPRNNPMKGIRITEFKEHVINPDPIILQETDVLLEEFLSPTKLKALTGVDDLYAVECLEMIVDTSETSLGNFGIYLPNLLQLKLSNSFVPRIRDLGTSLGHLNVLWLSRSGLFDLDGIAALHNLQELYLAYNEIQDLSPFSMLDNLLILDLEGNLIDDLRQIEFLGLCSNLRNLTIDGNPVCIKPNASAQESGTYSYKKEISRILRNLKLLDDDHISRELKPVVKYGQLRSTTIDEDDNNKAPTPYQCPFEDDWQLINQCLDAGVYPAEEKLAINEVKRPGSSHSNNSPLPNLRPLSAMRPLSSCRPGSAIRRPLSSSNARGANNNNNNNRNYNSNSPDIQNDMIGNEASELTTGPALQGNPLKGLLARKKLKGQTRPNMNNNKNSENNNYKKTMETNFDESKTKNEENSEIYQELKAWREEHEKKLQERKKYFEPQVLKIEDYVEPINFDNDEDDNTMEAYNVDDEDDERLNNASSVAGRVDDETDKLFSVKIEKPKIMDNNNKNKIKSLHQKYNSLRISSASSVYSSHAEDESIDCSRLTTGDTGYTSNLDMSLSSSSSFNNLKETLSQHRQPPVIIGASSTASGSASKSQVNSLKQLKTNMSQLSNIKYVKNS